MTLPPSLTKILTMFRGFGYGDRPNPARDWGILLVVLLVLLGATVAWNAWFFLEVVSDDQTIVAPEVAAEDTGIAPAKASYELRAAEEARYHSDYRFNDPLK